MTKVSATFVIYGWLWDTYNNLLAIQIPTKYQHDTDGNIIEWFEQQLECDVEVFDGGIHLSRDHNMYLGVQIASVFTDDWEDVFDMKAIQDARNTLAHWKPPKWLAEQLKDVIGTTPQYFIIMNAG